MHCCVLYSITAITVIVHVGIDRKQLLLGKRPFQPVHYEHLCSFLLQTSRFPLEIEVLRNLLRDRAAAFDDSASFKIMKHRPEKGQPVKAMADEESLILRCDHCMHEVRINFLKGYSPCQHFFRKRFRSLNCDCFLIELCTGSDTDAASCTAGQKQEQEEDPDLFLHSRFSLRSRISQVIAP